MANGLQSDPIRVVVRTARSVMIDSELLGLTVPTRQGVMTIGPGARPMVVPLIPGEIVLHKPAGGDLGMQVGCGSLVVLDGQVRVVVSRIEASYDPELALAS